MGEPHLVPGGYSSFLLSYRRLVQWTGLFLPVFATQFFIYLNKKTRTGRATMQTIRRPGTISDPGSLSVQCRLT
mgnify:CR=1 FL=1